ncbi:hypothetical protein Lbir_2126 [Legionella birminghamensis]|uniref:Exo-alpha-sialidase n=1 Tax=Legionella birminghamensis TaxID=28083 RepID=A0A378IA62_9GAMM|nr:hypothetical protein [Legionella birminghamensis]KTC69387.1 hypothetical protein Lbir_2126 [Legionella birminghamensis]STX31650.1 Uncharacterised protein [Legionella birminghamensis]
MRRISYGLLAILFVKTSIVFPLDYNACDPVLGPVRIQNSAEETVFDHTKGCPITDGDYSDNPARPFIAADQTVWWFASNSKGYFKSAGIPVSQGAKDIISNLVRYKDNGQCSAWLQSRFNSTPNEYPVASYNNEIWMVSPFTSDGQNIFTFVHNEYHIIPSNVTDVYGNLIGAMSTDGGSSFQVFTNPQQPGFNLPLIASPYAFTSGKGGMFAQSNIIQWGDYYYVLIEQNLQAFSSSAPPAGVCVYRNDNLANPRGWLGFDGEKYTIPLVPEYPSQNPENPEQYLCHRVLPNYYRFSWTYNTVLQKFIIIGLDTDYSQSGQPIEAFVYTLANLDPDTGVLSPATNTGSLFKEYFLLQITWFDEWQNAGNVFGQAYPGLLDPTSPENGGDRNFQYSGANPYLYYTSLFPAEENHGRDRDVVRQQLSVENCLLQ